MTYSLIYSFLTERAHFRAAKAVKKAAKGIATVESGGQGEPNLSIIIKQWKGFAEGKKVASPYVWYLLTVLRLKLRSVSGRVESTRSESSSSDIDSDRTVLMCHHYFALAYTYMPKPASLSTSEGTDSESGMFGALHYRSELGSFFALRHRICNQFSTSC